MHRKGALSFGVGVCGGACGVGVGGGGRTEISASIALFEDSPRGETSRMIVISTNDKVAPAEIELEFARRKRESSAQEEGFSLFFEKNRVWCFEGDKIQGDGECGESSGHTHFEYRLPPPR